MIQVLRKTIPHVYAIAIFLGISMIYFYPQLQGNLLRQSDHQNYIGMSKEILDFKERFNEETLWTNSMFGGMPSYQIVAKSSNIINSLKTLFLKVVPRPIGYTFLLMIGFYILLICLSVKPWLAIVGGIAFGLSSLNMLFLATGHNSKVLAIAFIPLLLGSLIYTYRKNLYRGAAMVSVFTCLHLSANHVQMSYYFIYLILLVLIFELIYYTKSKLLKKFVKSSVILLVSVMIGVLPSISNLIVTYEYGEHTTRGKSELTITPTKYPGSNNETNALDVDYIKQYSLGFGEIWSLVIPNAKGGKLGYLSQYPEVMENVKPQNKELVGKQYSYWGDQFSSGGAFYFGASVFLLFLLGIFFLHDRLKWALLGASFLAILLSWKFNPLLDWFIHHVPLFSKFRDTKMMLILVQVSFSLIGVLFLKTLFQHGIDKRKFLIIAASACLLFLLFYSLPGAFFDFQSHTEKELTSKQLVKYANNPGAIDQIKEFNQEVIEARKTLFRKDSLRSFFFIFITALLNYLFILEKLNQQWFIMLLAFTIIADLWAVDKRYLNNSKKGSDYIHWVDSYKYANPFRATKADLSIFKNEMKLNPSLQNEIKQELKKISGQKLKARELNVERDKLIFRELNLASNYRVFSLNNPFSNSRTSYFHKSIGGYHGAKLKKFQELVTFYISQEYELLARLVNESRGIIDSLKFKHISTPILNMLNTKYIILDPSVQALQNPYHYGNVWFANEVRFAQNADEEIQLLSDINKNSAIIREDNRRLVQESYDYDSLASIQLEIYRPNFLVYHSNTTKKQLAVFSEIYYNDGWKAYLDGKQVEIIKTNYLLRAIEVPEGIHKIEFKFEPESYYLGQKIGYIGSIIIILFVGLMFGLEYYSNKRQEHSKHVRA